MGPKYLKVLVVHVAVSVVHNLLILLQCFSFSLKIYKAALYSLQAIPVSAIGYTFSPAFSSS